jgi:two-component system response regulator FlrC
LRERTADILPLAERLLAKHVNKMQHAHARLSKQAQACLVGYPWPGNVRELDNAIQRALILQQGGVIEPQDFCLSGPVACAPLPVIAPSTMAARPAAVEAESAGALGDDLRRREFQMIIDTLRAERGRRKEAAERLGISPRTLRYKLAQMRDAGMDVEGYLFAT